MPTAAEAVAVTVPTIVPHADLPRDKRDAPRFCLKYTLYQYRSMPDGVIGVKPPGPSGLYKRGILGLLAEPHSEVAIKILDADRKRTMLPVTTDNRAAY